MLRCASRSNLGLSSFETSELVKKVEDSTNRLLNLVDPETKQFAVKFQDSFVVEQYEWDNSCQSARSNQAAYGIDAKAVNMQDFLSEPKPFVPKPPPPPAVVPHLTTTSSMCCPFCKQFKTKNHCLNTRHKDGCNMRGDRGTDPTNVAAALPMAPPSARPSTSINSSGQSNAYQQKAPSGPRVVGGRSRRADFNKKGGGMIKRYSVVDRSGRARAPAQNHHKVNRRTPYGTVRPMKCPW